MSYPNVSPFAKTKAKRGHIRNTADPSHKTIANLVQTHTYTAYMQLTYQDTLGNTREGPPSRNTKTSCYSLTIKHASYTPHFRNQKQHLRHADLNTTTKLSQNAKKSTLNHITLTAAHSTPKHFKNTLTTKTRNSISAE
jgi:hypothetical protein